MSVGNGNLSKRKGINNFAQNIQISNEPALTLRNDSKNRFRGKNINYSSLPGKIPQQMLYNEPLTSRNTNKVMKTCISSASQKIEKPKMRVSFSKDEIKKLTNSSNVYAQMERLTKSQSNIAPNESKQRLKKVNGKKKKTPDLHFKKTSSLTNFEKVVQFKTMHKLYTEGALDKEVVTKEAIALIHSMNQSTKTKKQINYLKASASIPVTCKHSRVMSKISLSNMKKGLTKRIKQRNVLKTSERKYDAVILNNICVMGKKLTLWKRIKQSFESSTTTMSDDRSKGDNSTVMDTNNFKVTDPTQNRNIKAKAFSSYNHSYACYPVISSKPNCKWNITKLQKYNADFTCSKDASRNISPKCILADLSHYDKQQTETLRRESICSYTLGKCTPETENNQPPAKNEDEFKPKQAAVKISIKNVKSNVNQISDSEKHCTENLKKQVCFGDGNEMKQQNAAENVNCVRKTSLRKQDPRNNVVNPGQDNNYTAGKYHRKRSVKTQVTAKNDVKCTQHSKVLPYHINKFNSKSEGRIQNKYDNYARPLVVKHKSQIVDMNGDGLRHVRRYTNESKAFRKKKEMNNSTPTRGYYYPINYNLDSYFNRKPQKLKSDSWLPSPRPQSCSKKEISRTKLKERRKKNKRKETEQKMKLFKKNSRPNRKVFSKFKISVEKKKEKERKFRFCKGFTHFTKILKLRTKQKHRKKHGNEYDCDELFMKALRRRPYLWVYESCPWYYPHFLSCMGLLRQTTHVFLVACAMLVWCPCLCALELFRYFLCNCCSCES